MLFCQTKIFYLNFFGLYYFLFIDSFVINLSENYFCIALFCFVCFLIFVSYYQIVWFLQLSNLLAILFLNLLYLFDFLLWFSDFSFSWLTILLYFSPNISHHWEANKPSYNHLIFTKTAKQFLCFVCLVSFEIFFLIPIEKKKKKSLFFC